MVDNKLKWKQGRDALLHRKKALEQRKEEVMKEVQAALDEKERRKQELMQDIEKQKTTLQDLRNQDLQQMMRLENLSVEMDKMKSELMDRPARSERLRYFLCKEKIKAICQSFADIVGESVDTEDPFKQLKMIHKFLHVIKALRATNDDAESNQADESTAQ